MAVRRIVVCPMDDRRALPGIVDHLTTDLDLIARPHGNGRREIDVVDNLYWPVRRLCPEFFMLGVGVRAYEKRRAAGYRRHQIDHLSILLYAWITRAAGND
jgi:hypothetical protein